MLIGLALVNMEPTQELGDLLLEGKVKYGF